MRFALILAVALALAAPAAAVDLTGTWAGQFKCSAFAGTGEKFKEPGQLLRITQTGNDLLVEWVGVANQSGVVVPDLKSPDTQGELAIADCETTADLQAGYSEIAVLRAKVDRAKGKGTLKGLSIWSPSDLSIGDCKWVFKLTDTTDPGVAPCPAP